jgi:hypothetical protein
VNKHSRRLLRLGALLSLIPIALYLLTSDAGAVLTLELPSTWNGSLYTDLSGWHSRGPLSVWPADPKRLMEALRPGDRVRIHCLTLRMASGDEGCLLVYVVNGPAGFRLYGSAWNPMILAAVLASTLLPFLLCSILAIEQGLRQKVTP